MSHTFFKWVKLAGLSALLSGCGLTQTVTEATTSTAQSIFYKQVKVLHLDFTARPAVNTDSAHMSGLAVPTVVRVYQLRDDTAMDKATYDSVLGDADNLLHADLLSQDASVVKPGEGTQLDVPLHAEAKFVTVVALFRTPDTGLNTWRLTLSRNDLDPDRARVIELGNNQLVLQPMKQE